MDIKETTFVLAVHNLESSIKYYVERLGFKHGVSPPGWSFPNRDSFQLMIWECKNTVAPSELEDHSNFAYISVENADHLYNEFTDNDVVFTKSLRAEPWGMKEFGISTIDDHRIMFGQDV